MPYNKKARELTINRILKRFPAIWAKYLPAAREVCFQRQFRSPSGTIRSSPELVDTYMNFAIAAVIKHYMIMPDDHNEDISEFLERARRMDAIDKIRVIRDSNVVLKRESDIAATALSSLELSDNVHRPDEILCAWAAEYATYVSCFLMNDAATPHTIGAQIAQSAHLYYLADRRCDRRYTQVNQFVKSIYWHRKE